VDYIGTSEGVLSLSSVDRAGWGGTVIGAPVKEDVQGVENFEVREAESKETIQVRRGGGGREHEKPLTGLKGCIEMSVRKYHY